MAALRDYIIRYGSQNVVGGVGNLGGAIDLTYPLPEGGVLAGLWDHVKVDEALTGRTEFRCFYLKNTHPSISILNPIFVIQKDTKSSSDFISVGWGLSVVNVAEQTIAAETTYPTNVTFYSGSTAGTAAILGRDIPPLGYKAVWLRRTVGFNAKEQINDDYTIRLLTDNIAEEIAESGDVPSPSPTSSVVITGQMDSTPDTSLIFKDINAWIANLFLSIGNVSV